MPHEEKICLPSCQSKTEVFRLYKEDNTALKDEAGTIWWSSFIKMWRKKFKNALISKVNYIQIKSSEPFTVLLSFNYATKAAVEKCTIMQFACRGKWLTLITDYLISSSCCRRTSSPSVVYVLC